MYRRRPTVGCQGGAVSYERGTTVQELDLCGNVHRQQAPKLGIYIQDSGLSSPHVLESGPLLFKLSPPL